MCLNPVNTHSASAIKNPNLSSPPPSRCAERADKQKLETDAMFKLDHSGKDQEKLKRALPSLSELQDYQSSKKDDFQLNSALRRRFRVPRLRVHSPLLLVTPCPLTKAELSSPLQTEKKVQAEQEEQDDSVRTRTNLSIPLLPERDEDRRLAALLTYQAADCERLPGGVVVVVLLLVLLVFLLFVCVVVLLLLVVVLVLFLLLLLVLLVFLLFVCVVLALLLVPIPVLLFLLLLVFLLLFVCVVLLLLVVVVLFLLVLHRRPAEHLSAGWLSRIQSVPCCCLVCSSCGNRRIIKSLLCL